MTETGFESQDMQARRPARSSMDVRASMDGCTKCGICHAHCPVAAVTGDFPGPKFTGPQAERFRAVGSVTESAPDLCSGCGICMDVCPNDVAVTDIIALAKADQVALGGGVSFGQKLLNRPDLLGRIGSVMPRLANGILGNRMMRAIGESFFGIDKAAPLPRFAGRRFRRWLEANSQPEGPAIGYFSGCAVEHYDAEVGIATVKLLNLLGYRVEVPSSACCSLPMLSSGEWEAARPRAQSLIAALAPAAKSCEAIVGTSTSCTLTLRSKYAAYLDMAGGTASAVADKVSDIGMFLLDNHADELRDRLSRNTTHVLYHGPCQLRGHKAGQPSAELLSLVPGLQLELSEATCCGVAGTYGYQKAKRHIAVDVGTSLMEQIQRSRPALVLCDSETCRWNIEAATGVPVQHPVEFLLECME